MSLENTIYILEGVTGNKSWSAGLTAEVIQEELDKLPKEVCNSNTRFLDTTCLNGPYLCGVFDKLMGCEDIKRKFPDIEKRVDHILGKQLFGIAPDPFVRLMAERTVFGCIYGEHTNNMQYISNYVTLLKNKDKKTINKIIKRKFGTKKFDVVFQKYSAQQIEKWLHDIGM